MVTAGEHTVLEGGDLGSARGQVGRIVVTLSKIGKGVRIPRKLNADAFDKL
jgi:uridine nucleosidase